jgi:hypothetical protein
MMDWSNERYVRLYTRDTMTWLRLRWEGQVLLCLLIRKVDRAGILDNVEEPVVDISLATGLPTEHVKIGLERLIRYGVVIINERTLIFPNYMDAQECSKSDKQRQKESREKRKTMAQFVTKCDEQRDDPVTKRDKNVTTGHSVSQPVTPYCAVPDPVLDLCCADPVPEVENSPVAPPAEKPKKPRKKAKPTGKGTPTWIAYSEAYKRRYGVETKRSVKFSSQCLDLVNRLGEEDAPRVAEFYFKCANDYYKTRYHPLDLLVKDCEAIKAEMIALNKRRAPYVPLVSKRPLDII